MTDLRAQLQSTLGDGYTLERELGGGGMSRVFVAHENALGRDVVLKVLSPERAASLSAERFTREIKLAAALQDPHIVPVLAAGTTSEGLPYYTMPFVRGDSLRARLVTGAVPVPEALGILRNIAQALAYAHERGIVHRDIKPENVLLSRGTAVVTDFGIAKALSASSTNAEGNTLTSLGTSIGTPAYMAPEQALGDVNTDARADLYAWGVVAYELLAGAHPFAARSTPQAMVAAHISEAPPPLDAVRLGVPRDVVALVIQCLEKDPAQRPLGADALLTRLASATSGKIEQAAVPSRRRTSWVVASVAVVMLAVAGWALLRPRGTASSASRTDAVPGDTASPVRSLVVLPFESVGGDTANAYFAEGMADELSNALGKVPGLQLAGRSSAAAFRGKQKSAQEIGAALNVSGVLEGTVRRLGGNVRVSTQLTNARTGLVLWNDSFERNAKDVFAVQDDIAQAIVRALQVTLADGAAPAPTVARGTNDLEAYDLYQRGMYLFGRRGPSLLRARDYFQQAIARDSQFARAYAALGLTWAQLAFYVMVPTVEAVPPAVTASERALALDSLSADAWAALGYARTLGHQWRAADEATLRAVRLDPRNAIAQAARSKFLAVVGRVDEAAEAALVAVALDPGSVGHVNQAMQHLALAGRYPEAIRFANRFWEMDSTLLSAGLVVTVLWEGGQVAEARRRAEVLLRLSPYPGNITRAIYVIAKTGDPGRAAAQPTARPLCRPRRWRIRLVFRVACIGRHGAGVDGARGKCAAGQPRREHSLGKSDLRSAARQPALRRPRTLARPGCGAVHVAQRRAAAVSGRSTTVARRRVLACGKISA